MQCFKCQLPLNVWKEEEEEEEDDKEKEEKEEVGEKAHNIKMSHNM